MAKLKKPFGRLGRLFFHLEGSDYELLHISGVDNHLPDFLSRADCIDSAELKVNLSELVSSVDWEVEQKKDAEIKRVIELIEGQSSDADWINMSDGRRWLHERKNLYVVDKILKHGRSCLIIPHHMKDQVFKTSS